MEVRILDEINVMNSFIKSERKNAFNVITYFIIVLQK